MRYIVTISAVVLVVSWLDKTGGGFRELLTFYPDRIARGELWRIITWVFIPSGGGTGFTDLLWGAVSLYFYYFIGKTLEHEWGAGKFTIFYASGVVLNIVYGLIVWFVFYSQIGPAAKFLFVGFGPAYINLSMFFAFAVLYPDMKIMLFFIIPVKMKWLALVDAALFLYTVIAALAAGQFLLAFLPVVAIANFLLFCGIPNFRLFRARAKSNVIHFKSAAKKIQKRAAAEGYRHKCEVCGRTDVTNPELQFRYCSRCEGFHCFCEEHIENHQHRN
jgi:hypothetical protein